MEVLAHHRESPTKEDRPHLQTMSSLYKQLGFSNPDKQIRLLRLEPSPTGTDEYAFSMGVYDFQENTRPLFIAISYTWGWHVPMLPVVINGFRMAIRFNCWYALWQMRHHGYTSDVNFWIDSLCINQGNDEEKGHQVAMMGEIFASASLVAASLGTGEGLGNVPKILASEDNHEIGKLGDRFDQLPYFDRAWIKQEIVLAKDISIFHGLDRMSWGEFDHVVNASKTTALKSQNDNSYFSSILGSSQYQYADSSPFRHRRLEKHSVSKQLCSHRSQVTETLTLMDLVVKYETAKASVAADKIYALLSLLPQIDPIRRNLPVTYGEATWFPLFQTLVRLLYSHYQYQDVGDKHSVLCMIRDSLGICGLDEDVGAFLASQVCHPLDARSFHQECATIEISCLHVLNDEKSEELGNEELRIDMNHTEPPDTVRNLGLSGHDGNTDHNYRPRSHTGRDSHGILPKLHIPPQLKSWRTLYNFTPDDFLEPGLLRKQFLVNSDVRPGDLLGTLIWDENGRDLAHVILRRTTFADERGNRDYDLPIGNETRRRRTAFFLHSWAIPVRQKGTMLSDLRRIHTFFRGTNAKMRKPNDIGQLRLHYLDALVPLLLDCHPLQSLLYSKSALNHGDINLLSRVENPEDLVETLENRDSGDGWSGCMCRNFDD